MKWELSQQLISWHKIHKEKGLYGRYITIEMIEPILMGLTLPFTVVKVGKSFQKKPIYKISVGSGDLKILIWSQMHGNETTGTKAVFDMFKYLSSNETITKQILKECTLVFIPMLNPDGASAYTRVNAQEIDLNRDAVALKAEESRLLQGILKEVEPKFCFNLHDQRTIFSVGKQNLPATMSFLAPSVDESRTETDGRKVTMSVIVAINNVLQEHVPNQIGRYTDEFYPTATGDNFEKLGYHTILMESGHFKDDYQREKVRCFTFLALVSSIYVVSNRVITIDYNSYFNIPNNKKQYLDIIYKNVLLPDRKKRIDIGILFKEQLIDGKIIFKQTIDKQGDLSSYNANSYIDLIDKKMILADLLKN